MGKFGEALNRLSNSVLNAISSGLDKKCAQNQINTAQMEIQSKLNYQYRLHERFIDDYRAFAGGFKNCLESNHTWYGLFCPKRIEDIFPQSEADMIDGQLFPDGRYQNIVFRFEVRREAINLNVHTISSGTVEYVPAKEVERQLQADLAKYIGKYYFAGLAVFEIPDNRLKIVIRGVDCSPTQPLANFGGVIW